MRESDAKKGLVLGSLKGEVGPIAVRSLEAGSDKGETELRLPLRLFVGFVWFLFGRLADFVLNFLCHLCLVFVWPSLYRVFVWLCLGFVFVFAFVFSLYSLCFLFMIL